MRPTLVPRCCFANAPITSSMAKNWLPASHGITLACAMRSSASRPITMPPFVA